jgi:hypothetical protein
MIVLPALYWLYGDKVPASAVADAEGALAPPNPQPVLA